MTIKNGDTAKKKTIKKVTRKVDEPLIEKEEESPVTVIDPRSIDSVDDLQVIFPSLEGRMLVVKVGDENNPVSDDQLIKMEKNLNELLAQFGVKCLVFVTNHFVDVSVI